MELAVKAAFKNDKKIYYLYQNLPKRLRDFKCIAESDKKFVRKLSKSYGTRWIEHKLTTMKAIFDNCSAYMAHIESLSQSESQPQKCAEQNGFIFMTIYLDVVAPLKCQVLDFSRISTT